MNREVFQFGCIVLLFSGTQYICGFLTFFFFFFIFYHIQHALYRYKVTYGIMTMQDS